MSRLELTKEEKQLIFALFGEESHYHVDEGDSIEHATFPSEGIYKEDHGQWGVGVLTDHGDIKSVPTRYRVQSLADAITIYSAYINGPLGDN